MLVRYNLSSVLVRLSMFSQLSIYTICGAVCFLCVYYSLLVTAQCISFTNQNVKTVSGTNQLVTYPAKQVCDLQKTEFLPASLRVCIFMYVGFILTAIQKH